ncbi:unnamed protein product [Rhizophagus irregularis]|nr:unnamed protein product [Rhizophagus irregularis]CAB5185173.1 unnamed protein product [Rhizophagus irregularis]
MLSAIYIRSIYNKGEDKLTISAPRPNLPMGSVDYGNHGLLFIFPNDATIGTWTRNVSANIPWPNIKMACQTFAMQLSGSIVASSVHFEDYLVVFE